MPTNSVPKFTFLSKKAKEIKPIKLDLDTLTYQFIEVKRLERRSPKTIKTYAQTLNAFKGGVTAQEVNEIGSDVIKSYINYLSFEKRKWDDHPTSPTQGIGTSPRHVNNTLRILRVFFNYLINEQIITHSPASSLNYQKEPTDTFEIFTDEDVLKLLSTPNIRTYTGYRDYVMMLTLVDTRLRIKELTSLRNCDIDFALRQITIRAEVSKTNTTRVIPVSKRTAKEIEKLMDYMNVNSDDFLWLSQFGERYLADTFAKMLKKYGKKAGITGVRCSPHTFRHYFAVKFLRECGDPISLMRILGHTDLAMTQRYVKYTSTDLSSQHDKYSPVATLIDKGNHRISGRKKFI